MGLLNDQDETVARGALRGFAARGDSEAVEILGNVLFNPQKPESVRTEAALALGDVAQPGALNALVRAVNELQDPALSESILEGLGKRPFAETETFFSTWLESSGVSADFKVTALEALGNSSGDVAPLLLKYASDQDPEVRAAAAWALSASPTQTDVGPQLLDLLSHEASPEVRTRLYQALGGQENYDVETVLSLTQKEFEPSARLAALNLLAEGCRSRPSSELLNYFNASAVPELKSIALTDRESQRRLSSVMTLRRADTAESVNALQEIAQRSTDTRTVDAANSALRARLHL
jgi:HEAT repeat protein